MSDVFARVAARANEGGLPIGAEAVQEIDRLLFEERLASIKRGVKPLAADVNLGVGGEDASRQDGESNQLQAPSHSGQGIL